MANSLIAELILDLDHIEKTTRRISMSLWVSNGKEADHQAKELILLVNIMKNHLLASGLEVLNRKVGATC